MSAQIRALQAQKAAAIDKMKALAATLVGAKTDFTPEEQASYDALKAEAEAASRGISRQTELEAMEAGLVRPTQMAGAGATNAPNVATVGASGNVQVTDNAKSDPKRGFQSKGDFFKAVKGAAMAMNGYGRMDPRLAPQAAAPGGGMNESDGADGGFAIPPEFSEEIWRISVETEGSLLPLTSNTEITTNSMAFPKDEKAPWDPSGAQAYWKGEGSSAATTKPVLGIDLLRLKELMVLVPVTNELLEDAPALGGYLTGLAADRIQWKTNEAVLFGPGGQQPLGCMTPPVGAATSALIVQAKTNAQATGTLTQANISSMRSRLKTGELKNAIWLGNPDILAQLEGMTVGSIPIFLPPGTGLHAGFDGTLNGRPLILSEHANTIGSQSDISLLSLKGYRTITKAGGIETATSMHLYFDANATAFRFIFRLDGQPITTAPIPAPPGKGSQTRSYFVTLAARP